MGTPRNLLTLATLAAIAWSSASAETHPSVQQAAPTKPVAIKNLEAPVFQSDTKNLEAILDKDQEGRNLHEGGTIIRATGTIPAVPVAARPMTSQPPILGNSVDTDKIKIEKTDEEDHGITANLTALRVFAIRWRDVFDILFAGTVTLFIRKLYLVNREQYKIMIHCARAAEEAARSARKSADIAEIIGKHYDKNDDAQGKFDLG